MGSGNLYKHDTNQVILASTKTHISSMSEYSREFFLYLTIPQSVDSDSLIFVEMFEMEIKMMLDVLWVDEDE